MKFSLRVKELRESKGLSQAKLAKALNVGTGSVGMWESTDQIPPIRKLIRIAEYFDVSIDYLIGREEVVPITNADRAAGWSDTANVQVSPIEYDMLQAFRKIGEKYGRQTQETTMSMLENMLGLK